MIASLVVVMASVVVVPVSAGYATIPSSLKKYVSYAYYDSGSGSEHGVELKLTYSGIYFGRTQNGCWQLSNFVRGQSQWKGSRSGANVASEIKWHCKAWRGYPLWWKHRLNPVNIEYFQGWPQSSID